MKDIPVHKIVQQTDFGVFAKKVAPCLPKSSVDYTHRDDYYIFGMVDCGNCRVSIDFKEYHLSGKEIICTQPGQIHHIADTGNATAFLLFVDGIFIDASMKQILAEYALSMTPFKISNIQHSELKQLFSMILRRVGDWEGDESKRILQDLSCAVAGIITDVIQKAVVKRSKNKRHVEITLAFKELLTKEKQINRNVSRYAESLHLSPVYLNEVIKDVTGMSVSRYIQNELILRAKRMLVYTSLSIREISAGLGIDNHAYFTRLFTKAVGVNPSSYRKKYLG